MNYLTFEEAVDIVNEGGVIKRPIYAKDKSRIVWIAEWHLPGCLSESFTVCTTKVDAIDCALSFAENENGPPYGMKTALIKRGYFDHKTDMYGYVITTVEKRRLADIL